MHDYESIKIMSRLRKAAEFNQPALSCTEHFKLQSELGIRQANYLISTLVLEGAEYVLDFTHAILWLGLIQI